MRVAIYSLLVLVVALPSPIRAQTKLTVPPNVVFEADMEYANPDSQHLQLDMARPKTADGPFPAVVCIHGGGFRAGSRKGYDALCVRPLATGTLA